MRKIHIGSCCALILLAGAGIFLSPEILPCIMGAIILLAGASMAAAYRADQLERKNIIAYLSALHEDPTSQPTYIPTGMDPWVKNILLKIATDITGETAQIQLDKEAIAKAAQQQEEYHTEIEKRKHEQESVSQHLNMVSHKMQQASAILSQELRHLSKMVAEIGLGIEEQKYQMQETSAAMEHIADSAQEISGSVTSASGNAQHSRQAAQTGQVEVQHTVTLIEQVMGTTVHLKDAMTKLETQSENIGTVMSVINEVADQTNLLALNAAIEAARAGDAGRGFAVVADEVRKLAEKTMGATHEIEEVVRDIQTSAQHSAHVVNEAAVQAENGALKASTVVTVMSGIVTSMDQSAEELENIAAAVNEQTENSLRTNKALEGISQVTSKTAEHMQQFTARLVTISDSLEEVDIIAGAMERGTLEPMQTKLVNWTKELETGLEIIDNQHKMLCAYINSLFRASRRGASEEEIRDIVRCLKDYTVTHFTQEEYYFSHSAYPLVEEHKKMHRGFVEKILNVEKALSQAGATVSGELLEFLTDWLIKHIKVVDHQYVSFVKGSLKNSGNPPKN